ncbi:MAG: ABC transporter ATP-binding protein [Gemmatimonadaceae bacterium]|nr:ABC transporter ATP-binding protein [Gemmatimonadaceae bacterium]
MLARLWQLLDRRDRRSVISILPLLLASAIVEIAGVAAVLPFIALLSDPASIFTLPIVGPLVLESGIEDPLQLLRWVGLVLAVVLLLANALVIATHWWVLRFSWSLNHRLSSRLLRRYLEQPYDFTLTRNTATLSSKVIVEVRRLVEHGFQSWLEIVTRSVVIVALIAFLVALDPVLALVVFGVLGVAYAGIFVVSRRYLQRIGHEAVKLGVARLKAVNEALGAFKDLKVTGREASAFLQYDRPARRYGQIEAAQGAIAILPRYALEGVAVGGMVLIAAIMAGRGGTFASTLPLLGAYAFAGLRLMPLMQQLFGAVARSRFAEGSMEAVEADFREVESGEGDVDDVPSPMAFERSIVLRDVRYAYPNSTTPVLDAVTIEIGKDCSLAVVGRTGAGKTTLIDVILGLLVPAEGSIEVDGVTVTAEGRRGYRRLFGYVSQHVYLLDDTISRNIALGLQDDAIDPQAVREACMLAQIAEFIEDELADGYATMVGERGVRLSGGQRQRIGIARALYHRPPILVFDEATSALDMHTERQLYRALEVIARSRTVITIAHRLETVEKADAVVVLEDGRVIDSGAPTDILSRYRLDASGEPTNRRFDATTGT